MLRFGLFIVTLLGLSAAVGHATVTLQFSQTNVARATGFSNNAGAAGIDGMKWGIVVSGTNATFSGGSYDVFDSNVSQFLKVGGVDTDDYYVAGDTTSTQTSTNNDPGGAGGITGLAGIFASYPTGINSGDAFQIIWFDGTPANGTYYGMLSDASFTLPADSSTTSYAGSSAFDNGTSADPIKPANLQFAATPEPSRMILLGLGALGFVMRRRRKA